LQGVHKRGDIPLSMPAGSKETWMGIVRLKSKQSKMMKGEEDETNA
jgi:hypothetical protein